MTPMPSKRDPDEGKAVDDYERAIELGPSNDTIGPRLGLVRNQFILGELLKRVGRNEEAAQTWRRAIDDFPYPFVDYKIRINVPGTYRLYLRWESHDHLSDEVHVRIVELADGPSGEVADWYRYCTWAPHYDRNFATGNGSWKSIWMRPSRAAAPMP